MLFEPFLTSCGELCYMIFFTFSLINNIYNNRRRKIVICSFRNMVLYQRSLFHLVSDFRSDGLSVRDGHNESVMFIIWYVKKKKLVWIALQPIFINCFYYSCMKTKDAVKTPSSEHCAEFITPGKLFTLALIDGLTLTDPWVFVKYIQLPKGIYKIRF